ncbi:hypothetical protein C8J57DRAFT_1727653 [Mycena rebaudengoi]|nr:hypothetical protein C8J57DRAFT_1727653 [Mycena rebaudengoi]
MAPASRKQITYAQKRNRSKPSKNISASSPLKEIEDPDHYTTREELSHRLLKRARRSSNPEVFSAKKLKSSGITPMGSPSQYETPHPSTLTEEQKFKLNSSKGLPMHPAQFSPLPVGRRVNSRTASGNLKENVARPSRNKDKFLDSPFNSRPNSAASSPRKRTLAIPPRSLTNSAEPTPNLFKRTLSDTNYNPKIPQSASTNTSPTHSHSPTRIRRPSAPSPPRPGTWIPTETNVGSFDFNFHSAPMDPFLLRSSMNEIDFNRPPSSLSIYGDSESKFFDEALGISTPASLKRAYSLGSALVDNEDSDDERDQPDLTIIADAMDVDAPSSPGMKPPRMRERSPWLSDSIISPPVSQEWNSPPKERAYAQSPPHDVDMYDEFSLGLGPGLAAFVPSGEQVEDPVLRRSQNTTDSDHLRHMFDGLDLAPKSRLLSTRTRSLDSPSGLDIVTDAKPKGRDRRGTIRASDFTKPAPVAPRRTRSGTVVGPAAPAQRTSSLNVLDKGAFGEVIEEDEELNGWCADGWAVAAPPSPVVMRKRRLVVNMQVRSPDRSDELDALSNGAGLLPSPVLLVKRRVGKEKAREAVMEEDEEDDELLLKPGFNIWE